MGGVAGDACQRQPQPCVLNEMWLLSISPPKSQRWQPRLKAYCPAPQVVTIPHLVHDWPSQAGIPLPRSGLMARIPLEVQIYQICGLLADI